MQESADPLDLEHNKEQEQVLMSNTLNEDYIETEGPFWGESLQPKPRFSAFWKTVLALVVLSPFVYIFVVVLPNMESIYRPVPDLVRVKSLDEKHLPNHEAGSRLILIGDIHGSYKPLRKLLKKVDFQEGVDHVLVLGDFTAKGPRSLEVLDYLMSINASCVRGNHEHSLLQRYSDYHHLPRPKVKDENEDEENMDDFAFDSSTSFEEAEEGEDDEQVALGKKRAGFDQSDKKLLARHLTPAQVAYIGSCPAIMDLGRITPDELHAVAVHGGLAWNVKKLKKQDPNLVMEVRSFLPPDYTKWSQDDDGEHWSDLWNEEQVKRRSKDRKVVFYAHDARNGLNIKEYTKGIDTGCVTGGELSAYVISSGKNDLYRHHLVSVKC